MHVSKATLITLIYAACVSAAAVPSPANEGSAAYQVLEARRNCINLRIGYYCFPDDKETPANKESAVDQVLGARQNCVDTPVGEFCFPDNEETPTEEANGVAPNV